MLSFVDKDQLEPNCSVLLHNKVMSVVGILADDADPLVSVMKVGFAKKRKIVFFFFWKFLILFQGGKSSSRVVCRYRRIGKTDSGDKRWARKKKASDLCFDCVQKCVWFLCFIDLPFKQRPWNCR
jgi:hypothetical protein